MWHFLRRLLLRGVHIILAFMLLTGMAVLFHRFYNPAPSALMVDWQHTLVARGQPAPALQQTWVAYPAIAAPLKMAVVTAEDQKFPVHHGFDLEAINKAWVGNQQGDDLRGASTISMQVAKNVYLWPGRSWLRKGLEAWFTLLIETFWSKQRILEVYLNVAQFDANTFGAEAAAQQFFNKPAARLNRAEAALLAAVLPAPTIYKVEAPSAYIRQRQFWILWQMRLLGTDYLAALEK